MYGGVIALTIIGLALYFAARSRSRLALLALSGLMIGSGSLLIAEQLWVKIAWKETVGTVVAGALEYDAGSASYSPLVRYAFTYGGEQYHGQRFAFGKLRLNRENARRLLQSFRIGDRCSVHFDSRDPTRSIVDPTLTRYPILLIFFGVVPIGIRNLLRQRSLDVLRRLEATLASPASPGRLEPRLKRERIAFSSGPATVPIVTDEAIRSAAEAGPLSWPMLRARLTAGRPITRDPFLSHTLAYFRIRLRPMLRQAGSPPNRIFTTHEGLVLFSYEPFPGWTFIFDKEFIPTRPMSPQSGHLHYCFRGALQTRHSFPRWSTRLRSNGDFSPHRHDLAPWLLRLRSVLAGSGAWEITFLGPYMVIERRIRVGIRGPGAGPFTEADFPQPNAELSTFDALLRLAESFPQSEPRTSQQAA